MNPMHLLLAVILGGERGLNLCCLGRGTDCNAVTGQHLYPGGDVPERWTFRGGGERLGIDDSELFGEASVFM